MSGPRPHEIAEARAKLARLADPSKQFIRTSDDVFAMDVLLTATEPPTNDKLAGIMADYCVDELKIDTDRNAVAASYKRDMESWNEHSYGRMARYLADRLFGKVTT